MKSYVAIGFGNNFFHPLGVDALPIPSNLLHNDDDIDDDDNNIDAINGEHDQNGAAATSKSSSLQVCLLPLHAPPPTSSTAHDHHHHCTNLHEWLLSNITSIQNDQRCLNHYASSTLPIVACGTTHTAFVIPESSSSHDDDGRQQQQRSGAASGHPHLLGTVFGRVHSRPTPQPTRLPLKIVLLASGRRHVLALTEGCTPDARRHRGGGILLSWGAGHFGQLGHGPEVTSSAEPKIVERLLPQSCGGSIVDIGAGGLHSLAVVAVEGGCSRCLEDGGSVRETKTFCWGSNRKSQCGIEGGKCATVPNPLPVVVVKREGRKEGGGGEERVDKVVHFEKVQGGRLHSVGLTAYGEVFTWGSTSMGRCGQSAADASRGGDRRICQEPRYVSALRNVVIESIAVGDAHTLALSKNGRVFVWGAGGDGQCGQGHIGNLFSPKCVREIYFENDDKNNDESTGTENNVQQNDMDSPQPNVKVELEVAMEEESLSRALGTTRADKGIVRIRAAGCYSAALSSQGDVFTWGYGGGLAMGHPIPPNGSNLPMLPLLEGNQYSYATSAKVYPGGCSETDNVRDCYSFDTELNVLMPRRVEVLRRLGLHVEDVSLGPGHMVVVCSMSGATDDNGIQHSNEISQSTIQKSDNYQSGNDDNVSNGDSGDSDSSDLIDHSINALNTESVVNTSMTSTVEAASNTTYDSLESSCHSKIERRRHSPGGFLAKMKSSRSNKDLSAPTESTTQCAGKEKKKSFLPVGKLIDAAFHRNGGK